MIQKGPLSNSRTVASMSTPGFSLEKNDSAVLGSRHDRRVRLYSSLLRVRPAQVADLLKKVLRVKRFHVRTVANQQFWIDPVSLFGLALLRTGVYEPQMTGLLKLVLNPGDTFLDVGGNEGYFSVIASSIVQSGQVHCFEPQSRLRAVLSENIRINAVKNVAVHSLAISNEDASMDLYLKPSTNSGASSMFHYGFGGAKEVVQTMALDSFFAAKSLKRVRLMKVDCEGAEYFVVLGAEKTLKRQAIDFIAMEYHPGVCGVEKCDRTHTALASYGYTLTKVGDQTIYHLPGLESILQPLGGLRSTSNWDS
jgi:FkbM family methyltransferase